MSTRRKTRCARTTRDFVLTRLSEQIGRLGKCGIPFACSQIAELLTYHFFQLNKHTSSFANDISPKYFPRWVSESGHEEMYRDSSLSRVLSRLILVSFAHHPRCEYRPRRISSWNGLCFVKRIEGAVVSYCAMLYAISVNAGDDPVALDTNDHLL